MSGVNQDAFKASPPPAEMGYQAPAVTPQREPSLIPDSMLSEAQQAQALTPVGGMQAILGLTPEQAEHRLQFAELQMKAQRESREFWFKVLGLGGSLVTVAIVGLTAIFQLGPGNRANSYASLAETIGRPEIKIDCGFRFAGECDAGEMAQGALATFRDERQQQQQTPAPAPVTPVRRTPVLPVAQAATPDPRKHPGYQRAYDTIHRWSREGHGINVVASHYYWLSSAQLNPSSPDYDKARKEPDHSLFKLAFQDFYNHSL